MKRKLIVRQDGFKECGVASLLSIIRYYGGNVSVSKLLEMTKTDKFGTNFYNIKLAAEQIGMDAMGYKIDDINKIKEIKKPFMCQIIEKNYEHFVVVYECKKNKLIVMDPAIGKVEISYDDFVKLWTSYIMIFAPRKRLLSYKEEKYLNKVIFDVIKKNKGIVFNIVVLSFVFMVVSFVSAMYFQVSLEIDNYNNLLVVTFIFSLLLLTKCITSFFRNELLIYLNQKIDYVCILETFQKVLLLPFNYYKNKTTGEIISRINDLIYVKNVINKLILTVSLDFIIFISSGIILFNLNLDMFIILVLVSIVYILIFFVFRNTLKKYTNINQINNANINSYLVEVISSFETIKNLNLESFTKERMEDIYVEALNDNFVYSNISNLELFMKDLVYLIGILLVEFLGFYYVDQGIIMVGSVITFTYLAEFFLEPVKNIIDLSKEYFYAVNSIKRVNNLFEIDCDDFRDNTNYFKVGNIVLKNVNFSYNGEDLVLSNINFEISNNDKIMLLGNSGSGKSTILKLLLKYYQVERNTIYIDDVDINDYSLREIRENIACISQNEFIYTDTIKNNIKMDQGVSEEVFREVCKIVKLDDFVNSLFLGYDTKLEENGLNLSGGQRQRIVLARMLLKNKSIMLIDEGLNAMDINLERIILKNIFTKYKDRVIIVVSHRLENMDLFNKVIRLKNGSIVENNKKIEALYD